MPSMNLHTVSSRVLSRAFLERDLDPFSLCTEKPGPGAYADYMYSAGVRGDFDDDGSRRRGRRRPLRSMRWS